MEMRAMDDVAMGQDLTPPCPPLAFSLYDSTLLSLCSACSSPLSPPPHQFPSLLPTFPINSHHVHQPSLHYCSSQCSDSDSDLHLSSAEHHLLLLLSQSHPSSYPFSGDTSDLRAALRLLRRFENLNAGCLPERNRVGGLMSNRDELMSRGEDEGNGDVLCRIRGGAKAMAAARRMRDGLDLEFLGECLLEEAVLCLVLTNAVEVQVKLGQGVGVAVYDTTFSWINHSCSPNACYRFLLPEVTQCSGEPRLWITPAATGGSSDEIEVSHNNSVGCLEYGPRIIVRSIKAIKNGEEVSIAYTDLLQPKAMRQSELWLKYRFVCRCRRCIAWPPTYVDQTLEEFSAVNLDYTNLSSDHNFYRDEAIKKLTDYVDDATSEYLLYGNPESCCEKLEKMLAHGLLDEQSEPKEKKSQNIFRLHPLHHLSLSAYTTLASAYKIRATDIFAISPDLNEHQLEAFNMSRLSAGYSLLLASATHHLFLSEFSLVASVANFWTNAGESLLSLARSSVWNSFLNQGFVIPEVSSHPSHKCCKCALVDVFENSFVHSHAQNADFEDISREFLNCMKNITPKVWGFLVRKGCYLKLIKDPIDFRWLGTVKDLEIFDCIAHLGDCDTKRSVSTSEEIFHLGVHCLLYGGFLSSICGVLV
ncbi:protein SET DOMAIN GROUP 41 isoform X2 [Cornus florida]|uniref:protein SET DOMAIN GROUP 41 isoform X2 n=1 Tax=Cornus florida TaxID=4283 RepID=UPI00289E79F6|nr:protein SET DOMAIN GROUP 41 isoform X2 [Cornus florida]